MSPDSAPGEARVAPGGWREVGPLVAGFSRVAGRVTGTEPPAVFRTLGRNQRLFWGWLLFAGTLMPGGRLRRRETELVILRVATLTGSAYELTQHTRLAARAGVSPEEVARVSEGPGAAGWSDRERLLLEVTDELHHEQDLADGTWQRLRAELDERTCLEVVMLVGHYEMLATTLRTLRVRPDRVR